MHSRNRKRFMLFGLGAFLLWIIYSFTDTCENKTHPISDFGTFYIMPLKNLVDNLMPNIDRHALPADERLFQSIEEQEFPTISGHQYRIPHIIHQIYTDDNVPQIISPMIESFVKNNPAWSYMFWTYATGKTLISRKHPYLLDTYNNFYSHNGVKKADLLRLVVLYEFGGMYADIDVTNLRPMDVATKQYACILPAEPFEHAAIYNMPYILTSAVFLCRPNHPFLKFSFMHLVDASARGNPVSVTGPGFITRMFKAYNRIYEHNTSSIKTDMSSNSPSFYKGILQEKDNDAVYVPNSQYFIDTLSPAIRKKTETVCNSDMNETVPYLQKRACSEFISRREVRRNQKFTFTVHHWFNLWTYHSDCLQSLSTVPIHYIVPHRIIYH